MKLYVLLRNESSHATHHTTFPQCKCWLHDLWFLSVDFETTHSSCCSFFSAVLCRNHFRWDRFNLRHRNVTNQMDGRSAEHARKQEPWQQRKTVFFLFHTIFYAKTRTDRSSTSPPRSRSAWMIRLLQFPSQTTSLSPLSPLLFVVWEFQTSFCV